MEATTAVQDTDALCTNIVEVIADHIDADPLGIPPLATVVDPEALEAVVRTGTDAQVTFEYEGHTVVVCGDGVLSIDGDESAPPKDGGR